MSLVSKPRTRSNRLVEVTPQQEQAQEYALSLYKMGIDPNEDDRIWDQLLDKFGYEEYFLIHDELVNLYLWDQAHREFNMSLCRGRHEIPQATDGSIFPSNVNPLDVDGLERFASRQLIGYHCKRLNLYVTGLTVALVAVINVCRKEGIELTLYHYDRESNSYYPQKVA